MANLLCNTHTHSHTNTHSKPYRDVPFYHSLDGEILFMLLSRSLLIFTDVILFSRPPVPLGRSTAAALLHIHAWMHILKTLNAECMRTVCSLLKILIAVYYLLLSSIPTCAVMSSGSLMCFQHNAISKCSVLCLTCQVNTGLGGYQGTKLPE